MMADGGLFALGALVLLGTLTGFISGMLGIGGGTVVVPALVFGLPMFGIVGPDLPKIAMATSLALVIPTSIASAQAHAAKGSIDWRMLLLLAPSIVAGAFVTAAFAAMINPCIVMLVFILFALFTAWGLVGQRKAQAQLEGQRPGLAGVAAKGMLGGVLSSLLGLGVGFFAVPMLSRFVTMPRAIGTAAALALPMAMVGTTGYLMAESPAGCTGQCTGFVFLPAVAAIGISAVLVAPLGASAAHALPVGALRHVFAVFLLVAAGNLTYKTYTQAMATGDAERVIALGKSLLEPFLLVAQDAPPADAVAQTGLSSETPYFALVARFGPQRAFLPFVVNRGDSGAENLLLFAHFPQDQLNAFISEVVEPATPEAVTLDTPRLPPVAAGLRVEGETVPQAAPPALANQTTASTPPPAPEIVLPPPLPQQTPPSPGIVQAGKRATHIKPIRARPPAVPRTKTTPRYVDPFNP